MSKKPLAIFTLIKDEPEFLEMWVDHYYREGGPEVNLFILDNGSDPDALIRCKRHELAGERLLANVVPVYQTEVNHQWMRDTVQLFQQFLLQSYDAVLFAEVDELVFCRDGQSLLEYAQWAVPPTVWCTGYEVVQQEGEEPIQAIAGHMLYERSQWYPTTQYSKPLLSKVPVQWQLGFHDTANGLKRVQDPNLLLVHMHKVDYGIAEQRHARFSQRKWSAKDLAAGHGFQNLFTGDKLKQWFCENVDALGTAQPLEPIPDDIRRRL